MRAHGQRSRVENTSAPLDARSIVRMIGHLINFSHRCTTVSLVKNRVAELKHSEYAKYIGKRQLSDTKCVLDQKIFDKLYFLCSMCFISGFLKPISPMHSNAGYVVELLLLILNMT